MRLMLESRGLRTYKQIGNEFDDPSQFDPKKSLWPEFWAKGKNIGCQDYAHLSEMQTWFGYGPMTIQVDGTT